MSLQNIMTTDPVVIRMDDDLATIRDIFDLVSFHHLLVVEDNKLVGIVSDRDYLKSVNSTLGTPIETTRDLAALNLKAHQIMTRKVCAVRENASLFDVVSTFQEKQVSCLPVLDENNSPKGVISWKDIVSALASNMAKKRAMN